MVRNDINDIIKNTISQKYTSMSNYFMLFLVHITIWRVINIYFNI